MINCVSLFLNRRFGAGHRHRGHVGSRRLVPRCPRPKLRTIVVVVYQCTIFNVMVSLRRLKFFCIAWFVLCWNVKKTPASSRNLSNYYLTLTLNVAGYTHNAFHFKVKFIKPCLNFTVLFSGNNPALCPSI